MLIMGLLVCAISWTFIIKKDFTFEHEKFDADGVLRALLALLVMLQRGFGRDV